MGKPTQRTFIAYVEDKPGVLNRISTLFRRRTYNIVSLNVGRTHQPGISRMTFVVEATQESARLIEANLYKLVNVLSIEDITEKPRVRRDLALIKVHVNSAHRSEVLQICEVFRARAVDICEETLILEVSGKQEKIDALVAMLRPFGIEEMVQTGTVSMSRGPQGHAAHGAHPPMKLQSFAAK